jgi:hypothetical protein
MALGTNAGTINQGEGSSAIGYGSGNSNQGSRAIAIGSFAGSDGQGARTIAIGYGAGSQSQGTGSIAIGYNAGFGSASPQEPNTIILNASGNEINGVIGQTGSFYVNPVRGDAKSTLLASGFTGPMYFNPTTSEISFASSNNSLVASSPQLVAGAGGSYTIYSPTAPGLYNVLFTNQDSPSISYYGSATLYYDGTSIFGGYGYGPGSEIVIAGTANNIIFYNQSPTPLTFTFHVFNSS